MDKIIVRSGNALKGKIPISGAKNSALTLIPCALLTDEPLTLRNLPRLADIDGFQHLMNQFGISTTVAGSRPEDFGRVMTLEATRITSNIAPYDLVRKMRASILVLGPMLAREGEATVSLPGGCAIGNRPIDLHLKALEAFGVEIEVAAGYVKAIAKKGIPGGTYTFPVVSVGATENALMAAALAKGTCVLHNAAREPEIVDLCNLLVDMGAEIEGIGSSDLIIHGKDRLHGATYRVMSDRIEAGSYACAAAITGGDVELVGAKAS
ncbi:MAG TPA: UDP-N-acetylglucosamine 1-carboxyvinyltransferase, partial [Sphingorhabdus sp.]|nr:UDP-N-acetylglucosamine 1-carboxyvinyltransferase [Sphingorhabdus sp.]